MSTAYLFPSTLQGLADVSISPGASQNGYPLVWNNSLGKWVISLLPYSSLSGAPPLPVPVLSGGTGTQNGSITGTGELIFQSANNQNLSINAGGTGQVRVNSIGLTVTQPQQNTNGFGIRIQKTGTDAFFSAQNARPETDLFTPVFLGRTNRNGPSLTFMGWQGLGQDNASGVISFSARNQLGSAVIPSSHKAFSFYNFSEELISVLGDGISKFFSSSPSTSTTTGALVVSGGVGIGGALHVGGQINGLGSVQPGAPASATAAGTTGQIRWDSDYIYVCTATNTWKRVAISTWP